MSANEKMVMVPRQWAQQTVSAGPGEYLSRSDIDLLSEALNQAAQQGQGEPITLPARKSAPPLSGDLRSYGWNEYHDEIAKLGPLYTHADPAALQRSWQAGYDTAWYAKNPADKRTSVNPSDPAEVERLRAEVAKFRGYCVDLDSEKRELEHKMDAYKGAAQEAAAQRAQLAEARALLSSVQVEIYEAAGMASVIREAKPFPVSTTVRAPVRKFELGDAISKAGVLVERLCSLADGLSASAEPSAPVEIDERASYEKAVIDSSERFHPNLEQYGDHPEAEYRDPSIEWAWGLWQARAALDRKP